MQRSVRQRDALTQQTTTQRNVYRIAYEWASHSIAARRPPQHIFRPIDDLRVRNLGELYDLLEPGQLLQEGGIPEGVREE